MPGPRQRTSALALTFTGLLLAAAAPAATAAASGPPGGGTPLRPQCRTVVHGSTGTAHCFNPHATLARVTLHLTCRHAHDPDVHTPAVRVGPAQQVTIAARCRDGIARLWVSDGPYG